MNRLAMAAVWLGVETGCNCATTDPPRPAPPAPTAAPGRDAPSIAEAPAGPSIDPPRLDAVEPKVRAHVAKLAAEIGGRDMLRYEALEATRAYIQATWRQQGYRPQLQSYEVDGRDAYNVQVQLRGSTHPDEIVILGAHYDSHDANPGADDNASGVAVMLAVAEHFAGRPQARTLRFVAFTNEEPPYFKSETMGSWVYAKRAKESGDAIVAALALDCVGYFSDEPGSQEYPGPIGALYPDVGNFLGFITRPEDQPQLARAVAGFKGASSLPVQHIVAPPVLAGIDWSDHWSFWQHGYPGIMVTDTALYRNDHYHQQTDRAETLDYPRLAQVAIGLTGSLQQLASDRRTTTP